MSLRMNRAPLIALYSLCLLVIGWRHPAWLCSWNLNLAWVLARHAAVKDSSVNLSQAEACFRRALRLQGDRPGAWIGMGRLALLREDREGAQAAFRKAVELDQSQPLANLELAKRRSSEGDFRAAAQHYFALGDIYSLVRLGDALTSSRPLEALRLYEDAIAVQPGIRVPHTQLGKLLRQQDRRGQALIEFKRALDADPAYGWSWYHVATTCLEDGKPEECLDWVRSAKGRFPLDRELTAALQRLEARARACSSGPQASEIAK